ncbi:MAG: general secretion pathway protein GspK [Candidatus Lindowbacteria bacterium]|nr:general secretion pathway protein GspK [Candidatus Lindowbacteria bacterium]
MKAADKKGVAMLAALGVMIILGLLSSVFLAHMKLARAYAVVDAQKLKAHYLGAAGVEGTIARLKADSPEVDSYSDAWWTGSQETPLGDGVYATTVTDESARVNVLTAQPQMLGAILGGDQQALARILEYRSSNKVFTVEDLGSLGLGADASTRLKALCTTLGDGKVNINTASSDVLAALPGMDADTAQRVVEFRKGVDGVEGTEDDFVFAAPEDLAKAPGLTPAKVAPVLPLVKVNSNVFRVEAVGSIYKGIRIVSNKKITAALSRDDSRNVTVTSWES